MRWRGTEDKEPTRGDERIVTGFLFRPKKIGYTWRWLERASWVEKYTIYFDARLGKLKFWKPIRWFDIKTD